MPKVIKPDNPFTNVCWVSVLTTFSGCCHKFWLYRQFSSAQFETKEMMVMVSGATKAGFVLNSKKRLLSIL